MTPWINAKRDNQPLGKFSTPYRLELVNTAQNPLTLVFLAAVKPRLLRLSVHFGILSNMVLNPSRKCIFKTSGEIIGATYRFYRQVRVYGRKKLHFTAHT